MIGYSNNQVKEMWGNNMQENAYQKVNFAILIPASCERRIQARYKTE
jgi:hypothetical protein